LNSVRILVWNLEGKDPLKYLGLDRKKLLRRTLKNGNRNRGLDLLR